MIFRQFVAKMLTCLGLCVVASSCVGTRYLEANQSLLIKEPEIVGAPKSVQSSLAELDIQQPNKRLLGFIPFSYLVYMYEFGEKRFDVESYNERIKLKTEKYDRKISNTARESRKTRLTRKKNDVIDELRFKKENGNWLMQTGEPLAVYDASKVERSINYFENYLISNGYFDYTIAHEKLSAGRNRVFNSYQVDLQARYIIDSVIYEYPDTALLEIVLAHGEDNERLEKQSYAQQSLEARRDLIYEALTNNGYYTFSRQYITFEIDTFSLEKNKILLTEKILRPTNSNHLPYRIDSVQFISSTPGENLARTIKTAEGISFQFQGVDYSPKVLKRNILIKTDSLYSRENTINTQRQLSYLDAFKFVNINYDSLGNQRLLANIFTSPLKKYQTTLEVGAISGVSGAQQIPGPFVNLGLKNRNAFRSLDLIDLQGNFSLQGISNVVSDETRYSLIQYGAALGFTLPKFLIFNDEKIQNKRNINSPQTRFQLGYNFENRTTEYQKSTAEFTYSYLWRTGENLRYNFTPFRFSYIDVPVIRSSFDDFLTTQENLGNGALRAGFNSSVISSTSFDLVYSANTNTVSSESSFLRVFLENGGNLVNILGEDFFLPGNRQDQAQSGTSSDNFSFFRWAKLNVDYRKVYPVNEATDLAYRINIGVAVPYGEEPALPYLKRFFIGGSNSLRAWQVRRLGPGSFGSFENQTAENEGINLINYQTEQGGDMVIEASLEYRRNLVGFIDYAVFADMGNIWLLNTFSTQTDTQGDDGFFRLDTFWREFALGAGLGLRLDFSFFVFRVDGAVQIHDPAQLPGNRWVIRDLPFGRIGSNLSANERSILENKTNITIGIGLPF